MVPMELAAIGWVTSERAVPVDDGWDAVASTIALDPERFDEESVVGLEAFSHVEVLYVFHQVEDAALTWGSRHPRGNPDWPRVGIFAQRGRVRPNRLGATVCRLLSVDDITLRVAGLDAIDGTPVVDLKPYMAEFSARGPVRQPAWSHELMTGYWEASEPRDAFSFVQQVRFELFVADVVSSIRFYEATLGFVAPPGADPSGYVPVTNGRATIGLQDETSLPRAHHFRPEHLAGAKGVGAEIVLEVDDVDEAYERASDAVGRGAGRIEAIADRSWGRRDFRLVDPDGYYLRITS